MNHSRVIGGRCYTIDGSWYQTRDIKNGRKENGLVHIECFPAFKAERADKCLHCGHPVMEIEIGGRKFGGVFFTITAEAAAANYEGLPAAGGQVHSARMILQRTLVLLSIESTALHSQP